MKNNCIKANDHVVFCTRRGLAVLISDISCRRRCASASPAEARLRGKNSTKFRLEMPRKIDAVRFRYKQTLEDNFTFGIDREKVKNTYELNG